MSYQNANAGAENNYALRYLQGLKDYLFKKENAQ